MGWADGDFSPVSVHFPTRRAISGGCEGDGGGWAGGQAGLYVYVSKVIIARLYIGGVVVVWCGVCEGYCRLLAYHKVGFFGMAGGLRGLVVFVCFRLVVAGRDGWFEVVVLSSSLLLYGREIRREKMDGRCTSKMREQDRRAASGFPSLLSRPHSPLRRNKNSIDNASGGEEVQGGLWRVYFLDFHFHFRLGHFGGATAAGMDGVGGRGIRRAEG